MKRREAKQGSSLVTNLGLSGDGSDGADFLLLQGVDDAALADVGVSDETNRDLLLVRMKDGELTKELDERTFSERVVDRGVESECGGELGQVLDPSSLKMREMW